MSNDVSKDTSHWSNESTCTNVTPSFENGVLRGESDISYETVERDPTISDSVDTYCSSVNRLCLDFTRNDQEDTPSRITKCENFWRFVDTMPELEKIRVAGREVSEQEIDASLESTTKVERSDHAKFPWIHMLMKLKEIKLDETALAACKETPVTDPDNLVQSTTPTTKELAEETIAAIDQFEEDWSKRPQKTNSEAFRLIKQDPARKISENQETSL